MTIKEQADAAVEGFRPWADPIWDIGLEPGFVELNKTHNATLIAIKHYEGLITEHCRNNTEWGCISEWSNRWNELTSILNELKSRL